MSNKKDIEDIMLFQKILKEGYVPEVTQEDIDANLKKGEKELEQLDLVKSLFKPINIPQIETQNSLTQTEITLDEKGKKILEKIDMIDKLINSPDEVILEEVKPKASTTDEDDFGLITDYLEKPKKTQIEKIVEQKNKTLNTAVHHFERLSEKSTGEHKEDQSKKQIKPMKDGSFKRKFLAVVGAIAISIGCIYALVEYKKDRDAVDAAKKIVINKMKEEGFNSTKEYLNTNPEFNKDSLVLVYVFDEILDGKEMHDFTRSSTYDNQMHHYLNLGHILTVNGYGHYNPDSGKTDAEYSEWARYCINVIRAAYEDGTLNEYITNLMNKSFNNFEDIDFDVSYSFDLQGGRSR